MNDNLLGWKILGLWFINKIIQVFHVLWYFTLIFNHGLFRNQNRGITFVLLLFRRDRFFQKILLIYFLQIIDHMLGQIFLFKIFLILLKIRSVWSNCYIFLIIWVFGRLILNFLSDFILGIIRCFNLRLLFYSYFS